MAKGITCHKQMMDFLFLTFFLWYFFTFYNVGYHGKLNLKNAEHFEKWNTCMCGHFIFQTALWVLLLSKCASTYTMNPSNGFYDKCNGYVMLGKEQKRMNDGKWNVWLLRSLTFSKIWITMAKFETNKLLNVDIGMSQIIHCMKKST